MWKVKAKTTREGEIPSSQGSRDIPRAVPLELGLEGSEGRGKRVPVYSDELFIRVCRELLRLAEVGAEGKGILGNPKGSLE